jgi:ribosomal protein S18 acetylase RimI-like enzyme
MIRALRSDDIPTVAAWIPTVPLWIHYSVTTAQVEAQLKQALMDGDLLLVADIESEGSANGMAWCLKDGAFGRSAYLRLLGVQNGYTSNGAGAALLQETEQNIREVQPDLFLLVSDFNEGAQRFYQRQGYQQVGAIPGYVLPDVTELLFWKSLS